jgi:tRNA pseudouridine55 synthase
MVAAVRRELHIRRVGHTGTLDPFATGLLVLLTGRATRLSRFLVGLPKSYTGTVRLGTRTDTDDATGTAVASGPSDGLPSESDLRSEAAAMVGPQQQVPPQYSAKKIEGNRAFAMARRGEVVELAPVDVEVFAFAVTGMEGDRVHFTADVSSGTYIRALARDLGERLGCRAHLETLRRTRVGQFEVTDALTLDQFAEHPAVHPSLEAVGHLAHHHVEASERDLIIHGRPLPAATDAPSHVALVSNGTLLGVAESVGGHLKPRVVLTDE